MTYSAKQISNGNPIKTTIFGSLTRIKLRSLANGLAKYSLVEYPKLYHHILIMLSLFYEAIISKPPTILLQHFPDIVQIHSNQSVLIYLISLPIDSNGWTNIARFNLSEHTHVTLQSVFSHNL